MTQGKTTKDNIKQQQTTTTNNRILSPKTGYDQHASPVKK